MHFIILFNIVSHFRYQVKLLLYIRQDLLLTEYYYYPKIF